MSLSRAGRERRAELRQGILLQLVQDRDTPRTAWRLEENMVLSSDPHVEGLSDRVIGHMASTYVVAPAGGEALSQLRLDVHVAG